MSPDDERRAPRRTIAFDLAKGPDYATALILEVRVDGTFVILDTEKFIQEHETFPAQSGVDSLREAIWGVRDRFYEDLQRRLWYGDRKA